MKLIKKIVFLIYYIILALFILPKVALSAAIDDVDFYHINGINTINKEAGESAKSTSLLINKHRDTVKPIHNSSGFILSDLLETYNLAMINGRKNFNSFSDFWRWFYRQKITPEINNHMDNLLWSLIPNANREISNLIATSLE